jgi:phenylacetate-CoA ligase
MSLYTRCVSGALFPLHERLKGHCTVAVLRSMERSQWLTPAAMESLQTRRLRDFLVRIGAEVPYYRELFQTLGFDPEGLGSLTDLQRLPLTGKADIRANMELWRNSVPAAPVVSH